MNIRAIKTEKVTSESGELIKLLDTILPTLKDGSILAITSKIVSICEGSTVPVNSIDKNDLIKKEADLYLPPEESKYGIVLTVKDNILIPSAGIDESNADNYYVLWPKDVQTTANMVREYFSKKYSLKNFGVIITDSKTTPLRWGTTGIGMAHSGFKALNDYIGKPDIFGKPMRVTRASILDGLAAAAVLMMGEGSEQTPLALIEDLPFVEFQDRDPSDDEIKALHIEREDDLYGPIINAAKWQN